jgi:acyl-CoA thioesterase
LSLVGVHGGYVAAVATRAIEEAVGDPQRPVRTLSAQFLRSPRPGPVEIGVTIERRGRGIVFASARVHQKHRTVVLVRTTSRGAADGITYDDHPPRPRTAVPPRTVGRFDPPGGVVPHFQQADIRVDPDVVPFSGGGDAWLGAWMRPLEGEAIDTAWLVAACDLLPPALFSRTTGPTRAATVDYTVHLPRADAASLVPAGGWVYLDCRSPLAADGLALENGVMWAPDGTLIALSRQTRLADAKVPTRGDRPGEEIAAGPTLSRK